MGGSSSKDLRKPPFFVRTYPEFKHVLEVTPGFFNIRADFKLMHGMVNIGTHMSLARLHSGDFVAIDAVPLTDPVKAELDVLTENGARLIAGALALTLT